MPRLASQTTSQTTSSAPSPLIAPLLPSSAPLHHRVWRMAVRLAQGLYVHNAGDAAPAMAFHFFLSMIPLLVLVGFVIGQIARQRGVDALLGPAIETAPGAVEQLVRDEVQRMAGASGSSIAPLSVVGFVWVAATGAHGLMDSFEIAAGAPRRPWWKKRIIALGWVSAILAALGIVASGMVGIDDAVQHAAGSASAATANASPSAATRAPARHGDHGASVVRSEHGDRVDHDSAESPIPLVRHAKHRLAPLFSDRWERVGIFVVFVLVAFVALAGFYRFAVEHPPGVARRAWPGAAVALTAWLVISWGFGVYVTSLGRYALFYGSVATVAVLLMWFYLTSWALLIGAELNAQLEGLRDRPRRH